MTLREFIRQNRDELDSAIHAALGSRVKLNNDDREEWILNDEGLYRWARSEGVNV